MWEHPVCTQRKGKLELPTCLSLREPQPYVEPCLSEMPGPSATQRHCRTLEAGGQGFVLGPTQPTLGDRELEPHKGRSLTQGSEYNLGENPEVATLYNRNCL